MFPYAADHQVTTESSTYIEYDVVPLHICPTDVKLSLIYSIPWRSLSLMPKLLDGSETLDTDRGADAHEMGGMGLVLTCRFR